MSQGGLLRVSKGVLPPFVPIQFTTDSGTAVPAGTNLNVFGLSGSKTFGSGDTITVKSPPFATQLFTGSAAVNTGEFDALAISRTLPPILTALEGDLVTFICTTANPLIIQATGSQTIRIGAVESSLMGTATSTGIGNSISLRYDETNRTWTAESVQGNWITA
jgi:hypothetical protein